MTIRKCNGMNLHKVSSWQLVADLGRHSLRHASLCAGLPWCVVGLDDKQAANTLFQTGPASAEPLSVSPDWTCLHRAPIFPLLKTRLNHLQFTIPGLHCLDYTAFFTICIVTFNTNTFPRKIYRTSSSIVHSVA